MSKDGALNRSRQFNLNFFTMHKCLSVTLKLEIKIIWQRDFVINGHSNE